MKYNAIILGTDHNSYSVARSFFEAYGEKPIVVGAALLVPFVASSIAEVHIVKDFSSNDDVFVRTLNEIAKARSEEDFIFFAPTEHYVDLLVRNEDKFDFKAHVPYPDPKEAEKLILKSEFYKILEKIGVAYPKTFIAKKDNYKEVNIEGEAFLKADEYNDFIESNATNIQKGYHAMNKDETLAILDEIYKSNYTGSIIVQDYIHGGQGTEYSLNGYRSHDGKVSMVLARNLLSDMRPMWVGNHLVQVDHYDDEMFNIAEKITSSLDYKGLFNFDFKKDAKTGKVYTLEMNIRQGRTFYYATLGGVNLMKIASDDMILGKSVSERTKRAFMLTAIGKDICREHLDKELLKDFEKKERQENTAIHIVNAKDAAPERLERVMNALKRQADDLYK